MDIQEYWEKALKNTEIIRPRVAPLALFSSTLLPYIFLAESSINLGDTIVRKGEVIVEKPAIILPSNLPQFEGFNSEENPLDPEALINFLLVRGVRFPSLRYNNKVESLDLYEGRLKTAIDHHLQQLESKENTSAGLIIGPEDCWQFSILIFIAQQILKQSDGDIRKLWEKFRRGE